MELNELRKEINDIDDRLISLFVQRMAVAAQVADYKKNHNMPIYVPERETEILQNISVKAGPELSAYAKVLYATLFTLSRNYQSKCNSSQSSLVENEDYERLLQFLHDLR